MIDLTTRVTSLCNATSLIQANKGSTSRISLHVFIFGVHTFGVFAGMGYFSSTDLILSRDTWVLMPVIITYATLSSMFTPICSFKRKHPCNSLRSFSSTSCSPFSPSESTFVLILVKESKVSSSREGEAHSLSLLSAQTRAFFFCGSHNVESRLADGPWAL